MVAAAAFHHESFLFCLARIRGGLVGCCLLASTTCPACCLPVMPRFTEQVEAAVEALSSDPAQPMDENEFIDASRLVYDGIRDIRKAVLMIRVSNCIPDVSTASYHLLNLSSASFWNSADAVVVY